MFDGQVGAGAATEVLLRIVGYGSGDGCSATDEWATDGCYGCSAPALLRIKLLAVVWPQAARRRTRGCSRRGPRRSGTAALAADPQCSTPLGVDNEGEAVPGVDTARRLGNPTHRLRRPHRLDGCHRLRRARHLGEQVHLQGLVPRPTSIEVGFKVGCHGARAGSRRRAAMFGGVAALPAWQAQ